MPSQTCTFDQVLYGWSESNLFGHRGFGVLAASPGWLPLLQSGDDILGPVVAYPEPGRRGAAPPSHGGFAVLRGTPVIFRRIPSGTDALNRPGNYTVQILMGHGFAVDAGLAAGLLTGDWLESDLPRAAGQQLPLLTLPKPGPRRGTAAASPAICGAVLQGLRDERRVVIAVPDEAQGRSAVCDAVRRLPGGLGDSLTFSTLESEPERSAFDIALAVSGWETNGSAPGRTLRVDTAGTGVDMRSLAWGEALAGASAASLRGIPDPVTVAALGLRLDALTTLREDPRRLTPEQLLSVLTGPDGQAWAAEPGSADIARGIMAGMDPAMAAAFAKAAQRRPAVTKLLQEVGWAALSGTSRGTAEQLLRGLGESQSDIDMAVLAATPGDEFSPANSARYLRLLAERGGAIATEPAGAKVQWDERLMAEYPQFWFDSVVCGRYRGPRASGALVEALDVRRAGAILTAAHRDGGVTDDEVARRLWAVLPTRRDDRVALLRLIAASSSVGLGITFENLLVQASLEPAVRRELLAEFWPILARELRLPGYLGTDLEPVKPGVHLPPLALGATVVLVVALLAVAVVVGARFFG